MHTTKTSCKHEPSMLPGGWVLGENQLVRRIARHVERASEVQCTVLITGETGTGKEIWARLLHELGPRKDRPFVPVNCAALTATLAESQLFGHEKGAFTGALGAALGVFRAAQGGVVFLDEVGEMPLDLQPKLLRVLQQQEVTPVGASRQVPIDVQIVAATNRNLAAEVASGRFREDLYFRLNMVELAVPSLRERSEDIQQFVEYFSGRFAEKYARPVWRASTEELQEFREFAWPGNIRQLSHVIEQAYVLGGTPTVPNRSVTGQSSVTSQSTVTSQSSVASQNRTLPFLNLVRLREAAVKQALLCTRGNKGQAAKLLGVHANTLTRLISQSTDAPPIE